MKGGNKVPTAKICQQSDRKFDRLSRMTLRDWLAGSDFNLALSSSFFGFYAHLGVSTALLEAGLRPQKITGSSAGALVGAALASGMDLKEIRELFFSIKREDFWDPKLGLGILKGDKFREVLNRYFTDDFTKLKIPFEVGVFDIFSLKTKFLSEGPLADVVSASCAVPGMFHPVKILGRWYVDGGLLDKTGINHDDSEQTLGVFLTSRWDRYHKIPKLKTQHRLLKIGNLPRPHPMQLELGREAYRAAHQQTLELLDATF